MLVYMCKYTPIEIIESFGMPILLLEPKVTNFTQADEIMHANMCSYVKAVLEDFEQNDYDGMVLTTCCDSSRRLYDTLQHRYPEKFFYLLDLPRKNNAFALRLYEAQIRGLAEAYGNFLGRPFSETDFLALCQNKLETIKIHRQHKARMAAESKAKLKVCLAGARTGSEVKRLVEELGADISLKLTCTGIDRGYEILPEDPMGSYSRALMTQIPCMRMMDTDRRMEVLKEYDDRIDGIIYHSIKFCDIYPYEYAKFKDIVEKPMVKIETDATTQCAGQIRTRVEAFLESLNARKGNSVCNYCRQEGDEVSRILPGEVTAEQRQAETGQGAGAMYVLGIDSGSTSTNAVIMNENKEIVAHAVVRTGAKSGESAERILKEILEQAGLKREDITRIISTGYGRVSIPFADENVTEISCHGRGAHFLNPQVRTILDIGGQDSKAIRLDEAGNVVDFVMNDKCAAGTGRFLEMMARTLEVDIAELGPLSLQWKEKIEISSMCSVFAESEVISLIAQNKEQADIAHGIHNAIAGKALSLMRRVGLEPGYMMTGGVAKNPGMVAVLEEQLGSKLYIYEEPEIVGAIGAALYAF